jgi:hypothetical protein
MEHGSSIGTRMDPPSFEEDSLVGGVNRESRDASGPRLWYTLPYLLKNELITLDDIIILHVSERPMNRDTRCRAGMYKG